VTMQRVASLESLPANVVDAWNGSFMAEFPRPIVEWLLEGARLLRLAPGQVFYRGAHHSETITLALVVEGLLRVYMKHDGGRQVTLRYAGPADVVGLPALVLGGTGRGDPAVERWARLGGSTLDGEAIQSSTVLRLNPGRFRSLARQDGTVAWALARHIGERLAEAQRMLAADLFLPIRSRVAHHLLDLAEREGPTLIVRASHQEIAGAIGSVREVVSRVLKRMEQERLVARAEGRLILTDAAGLHRAAEGDPEEPTQAR